MKIRIALIDSDDLYLQRFVSTFNSKYFDKITIFSFSDPAIAESNMQMSKYDIVIAAENFDLTPFKDNESGEVNMVAIVLIIIVVIALVAVFKDGISDVLSAAFKKIKEAIETL